MFSVHGSWSSWSSWPNCNKPCNGGNKTRERMCNNPEPAFGGQNCEGPITETKPCNLDSCPGIQLFVRWGWIWFYMKAKLWFSLHARSQEGDSKKTVWKYLLSIVCWVIFKPSRTLKNLDEPVARGSPPTKKPWVRCHVSWVCCLVSSCSGGFSTGSTVFLPVQNPTCLETHSDQYRGPAWNQLRLIWLSL